MVECYNYFAIIKYIGKKWRKQIKGERYMENEGAVIEPQKEGRTVRKRSVTVPKGLIIIIIGVIAVYLFRGQFSRAENKPEIITESTLYKIIKVSNLSTYQCVYNEICSVMNEQNPDQVDYYCAYAAKVDAGIDFDQVTIHKDEDNKMITVTIPKVDVTGVNVDIASLDYMFVDDSANTSTVSEKAYKACIADVNQRSKQENKIYELAEQNAKNIVKALIRPFIEQMDSEYELEIETLEGSAQ